MKRVIIFLIVASLLILTACEIPSTETYCNEYVMPDGVRCDYKKTIGFNGELKFYSCNDGRVYLNPEYYSVEPYLSNSTVC